MLTYSRLRAHGLILAFFGWGLAVWTVAVPGAFDRFGTLKGVDFLQFYVAGWFVARGRAGELYDWEAFAGALRGMVPGTGDLLFLSLYPPQLALAFAPLARLPYLAALGLWTLVTVGLYAASARAVAASLGLTARQRRLGYLLALAAVPFQQLVLHGQVGVLVLALLAAGWLAFRAGRWWWLGVALGSLAFKPQFGTMAVAALVAAPSWRLLAGIAAGGLAQAAVVFLAAGPGLLFEYAGAAARVLASPGMFEPKVWQTHGLRGFFELLAGPGAVSGVAFALAAVGVLWLLRQVWVRHGSTEPRYAALVLAGLLLNPHLYVYDLVVLLLALALLAGWAVQRPEFGTRSVTRLAYALYWLPLAAPLAAVTHVQLTAPAMVALLALLRAAPARATAHPGSAPASRAPAGAPPPARPEEPPRS